MDIQLKRLSEKVAYLNASAPSVVKRYYILEGVDIRKIGYSHKGHMTSIKSPDGFRIFSKGYIEGDINRCFELLCVVDGYFIFLTNTSIYICSNVGKPYFFERPNIASLLPSLSQSLPLSKECLEEVQRLQDKPSFSTRTYIFGSHTKKKFISTDIVLNISTKSETIIVTTSGSIYVFLK
jgi:hypothetical protein